MIGVQKLRQFATSEGVRSSVLMVFGTMLAQGLSGIAIIILSRTIGPAQFGIFSTGFSLALIMGAVIDIGLTAAQQYMLPRAESSTAKNKLFATVIWLKVVVSVMCIFALTLISDSLSERLRFSSGSFIVWIALANLGSIFFNQLVGMLLALKRVVQTVIINVSQAVLKLVLVWLVIALSWTNGDHILLLYLVLPISIIPFASLLLPVWHRWQIAFHRPSWLAMRSMALNNWIASLGIVLIQNADIVLVGLLLSPNDAGLIGAASRIALFVGVIGGALAGVLNPRVTTYQTQTNLDAYWKKALLLFAGATVLALMSFILSAPLISVTVGSEYLAAAPVLAWLLAASWLAVGLAPLSALFYSYDKPWYFSASAALQAGLLVTANILLLPSFGITAAGWIRLSTQLVIVLFTVIAALYSHRRRFQQLPRVFRS